MAHNDFDEDSDWTAHAQQAAAQPSRRPQQIALVVCGMALGAAGASAAWFLAVKSSTPVAPQSVVAAPSAGPVVAPAPTPVAPIAATVATAPPAGPRVVETDEGPPTAAPVTSAPRAAATLSAAEVARRKELAWSRYYKRPASCEGNPSADQLIDCANHFIRAKREFDERWRTGTL